METRLYSLYEKQGKRWIRISPFSYHKTRAVSVFQSELLAPFLGQHVIPVNGVRSLRPVKPCKDSKCQHVNCGQFTVPL